MKRKHRRMVIVAGGMAALGIVTAFLAVGLEDNLVFFYSPSEIAEKVKGPDQRVRLGGLVEMDSMAKSADGLTVTFRITDMAETVPVTFTGLLPDLFREGQGVVCEGSLRADGVFEAATVLAKHDENYMPKEVADALKEAGNWQGANGAGAAP
jgi:cytochrome c-type biogenesis protein CcmE